MGKKAKQDKTPMPSSTPPAGTAGVAMAYVLALVVAAFAGGIGCAQLFVVRQVVCASGAPTTLFSGSGGGGGVMMRMTEVEEAAAATDASYADVYINRAVAVMKVAAQYAEEAGESVEGEQEWKEGRLQEIPRLFIAQLFAAVQIGSAAPSKTAHYWIEACLTCLPNGGLGDIFASCLTFCQGALATSTKSDAKTVKAGIATILKQHGGQLSRDDRETAKRLLHAKQLPMPPPLLPGAQMQELVHVTSPTTSPSGLLHEHQLFATTVVTIDAEPGK